MTRTIERMRPLRPLPEIENDLTRRKFLIGAGLITLAAGCGNDGGDERGSSGETRQVRHALGQAEIPVSPERIVVVDVISLDISLALGLPVVGAAAWASGDNPDFIVSATEREIEVVGTDGQPNLEAIAALEPDLILGADYSVESIYEEANQISPTVAWQFEGSRDWKAWTRTVAALFDAGDRAEEVISTTIRELRRAASEIIEPVAVLRVMSEDYFRLHGEEDYPGIVLTDAGVEVAQITTPSEDPDLDPSFRADFSAELLGSIEGETIFITSGSTDDPSEGTEVLRNLDENRLWSRLPAVRAGRVCPIDFAAWFGGGPLGVRAMSDDLAECAAQ